MRQTLVIMLLSSFAFIFGCSDDPSSRLYEIYILYFL